MLKRSLLAAVVLCATPAHAFSSSDLIHIEDAIEDATGTPVRWTREGGSCKPRSNGGIVLGVFSPTLNTITMCQNHRIRTSTLLNTLMHEGVHSMQDRCTHRPVLTDAEIRRHLTASDRREIRKFYPASQHRAEAEARAVANYYDDDPQGYVTFIRRHCA